MRNNAVDFIIMLSSHPLDGEMIIQPQNDNAFKWIEEAIKPEHWWWLDKNNLIMDSQDYDRLILELDGNKLTYQRLE